MPSFKTEKALLLHVHPMGERTYLLSLLTPEKGRYMGALKSKTAPDIGSFIEARWQARLEEQTGTFYLDNARSSVVDYLDDKKRLAVIACVCELLHRLLPERQPSEFIYQKTIELIDNLPRETFLRDYLMWEIDLLSAIGFGLDLTQCAGGGCSDDLAYVSPKTGRAVSREKGLPYHDKLLKLPSFLWKKNLMPTVSDLIQGFVLTTFFLTTHTGLIHLPAARERLIGYISKENNAHSKNER